MTAKSVAAPTPPSPRERLRPAKRPLAQASQRITSQTNSPKSAAGQAGTFLIAVILVLIPFHAFLSVWIGSSFGVYNLARVWKECVLLGLAAVAGLLLWRDSGLRESLRRWPVVWLVVAYVALHLVLGGVALAGGHVSLAAVAYGVIVNLRFAIFFVLSAVIAARCQWVRSHWRHVLLIPASVVVGFGLLQMFVLPHDFLAHVGYGLGTIAPYETVDQKPDYVRAQSTLRGPNPLGAYLIVVIAGALAMMIGDRTTRRQRWALGGLLAGSVVVLGYSYSRSAYIGAALAAGLVCWLLIRSVRVRRWLVLTVATLVFVIGPATLLLRGNDRVQNIIFHTNEHSSSSRSSNQDRLQALESGVRDLLREPLGRGPGTAGPASVYNHGSVRIAENYYLQIGQETGWLGLVLFVSIVAAVGIGLLKQRANSLAAALFASLIGISVAGLATHIWADDTLSLLWWGLAGAASPFAILKNRNEVR